MAFRKPVKPKSTGNDITDAIRDAVEQYKPHSSGRKRRWIRSVFARIHRAPKWVRYTIILLLLVNTVLIADGSRREGDELSARLDVVTGKVDAVIKGLSVSAANGMTLHENDSITTGANSSVVVVFPDGSAIQLEPFTNFTIRLLGFNRHGKRDQSFLLNYGSVLARVSKMFGVDSQLAIATPTAVAAVRGTCFRLTYIPQNMSTILQVIDGWVSFRCGYTQVVLRKGQSITTEGYQTHPVEQIPGYLVRVLSTRMQSLMKYEEAPGALAQFESSMMNLYDLPLRTVGVAPGQMSMGSIDIVRIVRCKYALMALRDYIVAASENTAPDYINPVTLAELRLAPEDADRLLTSFAGKMLLGYRRTAPNRFVVYVRARNTNQTLFMMTENSLEEVPESEASMGK